MKRKMLSEIWKIAYRENVSNGLPSAEAPFIIIDNPWWGWAADPFLFEYKGSVYLFAELYSFIKQKGIIFYCELRGGKFSKWRKVIEEPWHLSYPNVFLYKNEIYLLPESKQSNMMYCYRAVSFPDKWEMYRVLTPDFQCVDTTFYSYNGDFYGFTYVNSDPNNKALLLFKLLEDCEIEFSADNPLDVKSEICRPGGNVIYTNYGDYRISQDCESSYGKAIIFNKMNLKWPNYSEEAVMRWEPSDLHIKNSKQKEIGMHTYNAIKSYEVLDFKYKAFNLLDLIFKVIHYVLRNVSKKLAPSSLR